MEGNPPPPFLPPDMEGNTLPDTPPYAWILEDWNLNTPQAQRIVLMTAPMISGFLSACGSGLILVMLYKRGDRRRIPDRIFGPMSAVDVLSSLFYLVGPFLVPDATGAPLAIGTPATCQVSGFFINLTYTSGFYNIFFLLYVLLRVRYNVPEQTLAKCQEKVWHIFAFVVPLIAGTLAVVYDQITPIPQGLVRCQIRNGPPPECQQGAADCPLGKRGWGVLALVYVPTCVLLISFVIILGMIIITTHSTYQQSTYLNTGRSSASRIQMAMARQSLLFGVFFFNTYVWFFVALTVSYVRFAMDEPPGAKPQPFFLSLCVEIFMPLQGFGNFVCFSHFRFSHIRRNRRDKSLWWVLKELVLGDLITCPRYRRQAPAVEVQIQIPIPVPQNNNNDNNNNTPNNNDNDVKDNNSVKKSSQDSSNRRKRESKGSRGVSFREKLRLPSSEGAFSIGDFEFSDLDMSEPYVPDLENSDRRICSPRNNSSSVQSSNGLAEPDDGVDDVMIRYLEGHVGVDGPDNNNISDDDLGRPDDSIPPRVIPEVAADCQHVVVENNESQTGGNPYRASEHTIVFDSNPNSRFSNDCSSIDA